MTEPFSILYPQPQTFVYVRMETKTKAGTRVVVFRDGLASFKPDWKS